jgi:hypothetical protein
MLKPLPLLQPPHHQQLLDLLDIRVPLHDQHHDQTVPEPAMLGADVAQPISIA